MLVNFLLLIENLQFILYKGDDGKAEQDIAGNGEMYEIENEDSIAIDRNEGPLEYPREGFG